jgi:hypothetical protein
MEKPGFARAFCIQRSLNRDSSAKGKAIFFADPQFGESP